MDTNIETIGSKKTESVLKNRSYFLLFVGKFISVMGDQIYLFALGWYILSVTHSSAKMGMLLAFGLLPSVFIGPFAGIIADRFNRKNIMVLMDTARFFIVLLMGLLLHYGMLHLWTLYTGTILLEVCGAVFNPAATAIIPNIVGEEQYTQALSLDQLVWSICNVLGMLAGGVLFGLLGITAIFMLNAVSFLISGILEFNIRTSQKPNRSALEKSELFKEMVMGYRFLKDNRGLYIVLLYFAFTNFLMYPVGNIYTPYLFNIVLKGSSVQLAMVQASLFAGVIAGAILMPLLPVKMSFRNRLIAAELVIFAIELTVTVLVMPMILQKLSVWGTVFIFQGLSILIGMSLTFVNIQIGVIFQSKVPDEVRGRVSALVSAIVSGVVPVSYMVSGYLALRVPLFLLIGGTAASILLSIMVLARFRSVSEL